MINPKIIKKPKRQNQFKRKKAEVEANHVPLPILHLVKKITVGLAVIVLLQINLIKNHMSNNTSLKNLIT